MSTCIQGLYNFRPDHGFTPHAVFKESCHQIWGTMVPYNHDVLRQGKVTSGQNPQFRIDGWWIARNLGKFHPSKGRGYRT